MSEHHFMGREDLLSLSAIERISYVEAIRVKYPRVTTIFDAIRNCDELNRISAEPQCLMVLGPTGVGKTTLLDLYRSDDLPTFVGTNTLVPVLRATVPAKATIINFVTKLLIAIGDPIPDRGTIGSREFRLINFMKDCQTEIIIVDDLQHFVDRDSERVLHDVSNWLKNLVKETHVACIIGGLPEAEDVLTYNIQFGRLFGDPFQLMPFTWNTLEPKTTEEFRSLSSNGNFVAVFRCHEWSYGIYHEFASSSSTVCHPRKLS
jgi:hypothetical protein